MSEENREFTQAVVFQDDEDPLNDLNLDFGHDGLTAFSMTNKWIHFLGSLRSSGMFQFDIYRSHPHPSADASGHIPPRSKNSKFKMKVKGEVVDKVGRLCVCFVH